MGVATITAVAGLGLSAYQTVSSAKQQKEAKEDLEEYNRQNLDNAFENIAVSTVGSDILKEEAQRTSAMAVDALQGSDTRAMGSLPGVVAENNRANRETRKYLDDQIINRDYAVANDKSNIRQMMEYRESADLAGIGNSINVARQDFWNGLQSATGQLGEIGNYVADRWFDGEDDPTPPTVVQNNPI